MTFEPITVRFALTQEVMFRAHNLAAHKSKRQLGVANFIVYGLLILLAAALVLFVVTQFTTHGHMRIDARTRLTLIGAAFMFGFWFFMFTAIRKGWFAKKQEEQYEVVISEEGIDACSSSTETRFHWDHFTDVLENRYLLLLIARDNTLIPFPQECFTTPEDRERLRALLAEKIGPVRWEDKGEIPHQSQFTSKGSS